MKKSKLNYILFISQDIDVPPSEELWSKLKELKHLCSDCPKVILSEASQLEQKMEKLKQALNVSLYLVNTMQI